MSITLRSILIAIAVVLAGTGCARRGAPDGGPVAVGQEQRGMASYYADHFHGNTTANGERFDRNAMTAAHRSLPFGSEVVVTNRRNGKTVRVRINDRGPFVDGRVIDLTPAAARRIDMIRDGVVPVIVTPVRSAR